MPVPTAMMLVLGITVFLALIKHFPNFMSGLVGIILIVIMMLAGFGLIANPVLGTVGFMVFALLCYIVLKII